MKSACIRLNAFEAETLYDALQEVTPPAAEQNKFMRLTEKLGNILRQARVAAGVIEARRLHHTKAPRGVQNRHRGLRPSDSVELLEPRGDGDSKLRLPK